MSADWVPNVTGTITPARALADAGLTLAEIAGELGMTEAQVARLPELADHAPGQAHDNRVEQALYAVAVGGLVKRTVVTGERGETVTEAVQPPDPKAAQAWLQARRPEQWGEQAKPKTVQYVAFIPMQSASTAEWLEQVRDSQRARQGGRVVASVPVGGADPDSDCGDVTDTRASGVNGMDNAAPSLPNVAPKK